MLEILTRFKIDENRYRLISLPQNKVSEYLTAMDLGLLLRAPSVLNNFSQPVKFGEYLSAGIPVVLEEGTGDISLILNKHRIGCVIKLTGKDNKADFDAEVTNALNWYQQNMQTVRTDTKDYIDKQYTWKANVQRERMAYAGGLKNQATKK